MKKLKRFNLFFVFILLISCFSNKYELIGKKKVKGSQNLYVKFFQLDAFEHISPIDFELLNENDSILIRKQYLTGDTPMLESVNEFSPILYDSIFYICYPYPKVYTIHHLNPSKSNLSRDELFEVIKKYNGDLIDSEK